MDRDEILKMAQNRKPNQLDEMEQQILRRGNEIGMALSFLLCVVLMVAKIAAGQSWSDVYSIYIIVIGGRRLYRWKRLGDKKDLTMGIVWCALAVLLAGVYIWRLFG